MQADENTKIEYNEQDATLAEFQIGDHAVATYNAQTLIASKISGESQEEE